LTVKAIEFQDATGAYGAFTFYRRPTMSAADIGSGAAFDGKRVLFWSGKTLADATFEHITPMSPPSFVTLRANCQKQSRIRLRHPGFPTICLANISKSK